MTPAHRNDAFDREFNQFFLEQVRPLAQEVTTKKSRAFRRSLLVGAGAFLVFVALAYYFTKPYFEMLGRQNLVFWPLILIMPITMGVIAFCLAYILNLRTAVVDFRGTLLKRLAEFIDPGAVHESDRSVDETVFAGSGLFEDTDRPESGKEHFRGRYGAVGYEFSEVRQQIPTDPSLVPDKTASKAKRYLTGIFYRATFDRRFREAGRFHSGVNAGADAFACGPNETGGLAEMMLRRGVSLHLSREENRLAMALLGENSLPGASLPLDDFDIERYREFSRDARLCLETTRAMACSGSLWE